MMERTHRGVWVDVDDPPPPAGERDGQDEPFVTEATPTKQSEVK